MTKRLLPLAFLLLPAVLVGQELVTLTTPIVKTATTCTLDSLLLDVKDARIVASVTLSTGDVVSKQYDGFSTPTGATLLHTLNTGNFAATSLIKGVYGRLATDGVCVGTVSGTPQD